MKKRIACRVLVLMLLLLMSFTAHASESVQVDYDIDADIATAKVSFSSYPSSVVSVVCLQLPKENRNNPGTDFILNFMATNPSKVAAYTHAVTASDGSLEFEFGFRESSSWGVYTVIATNGSAKACYSFTRINEQGITDNLKTLNFENTSLGFYTKFKELLDDLLLPVAPDKFDGVTEVQLKKVAEYLFNNKTENKATFVANCEQKKALVLIEDASRTSIVSEIKKHADVLGINASYAESLSPLQSVDFLNKIENEGFTNKDDFVKKYNEGIALSWASKPQNYSDIKRALSTFDEVAVDFDGDYKNLKDTSAVFKAMLNQTYATVQELKDAFNIAVANQKALEEANSYMPGTGLGGGGGGGGSISGGNKGLPPVAPQVSEPSKTVEFTDLGSVRWASEAINALKDKGVVQGDGNGLFKPENMVTRAEFVKMLIEALDLKVSGAEASFDDVPKDSWAYPYIASAYNLGIVSGVNKSQFDADKFISRQDMAVIIYNVCNKVGIKLGSEEKAFADEAEISDYAKDAVSGLSASNIILGTENGFEPKGNATRAQSAVIIFRVMEVL